MSNIIEEINNEQTQREIRDFVAGDTVVVVGNLPFLFADWQIDPPSAPIVVSIEDGGEPSGYCLVGLSEELTPFRMPDEGMSRSSLPGHGDRQLPGKSPGSLPVHVLHPQLHPRIFPAGLQSGGKRERRRKDQELGFLPGGKRGSEGTEEGPGLLRAEVHLPIPGDDGSDAHRSPPLP